MLRNPVDMMISLQSQLLYNSVETLTDFRDALADEEARRTGTSTTVRKPRIPVASCYRHVARYPEQVRRYLDTFGRDNVHVIIFDDLKADTAGAYRRTLEFLGVDPTFAPAFERINANKSLRWTLLQRLIWTSPLGRSYRLREMVPKFARAALTRLNSKVHERPPMDPVLREELTEEFAPSVAELGDLLGRDLTHWSRSVPPAGQPEVAHAQG